MGLSMWRWTLWAPPWAPEWHGQAGQARRTLSTETGRGLCEAGETLCPLPQAEGPSGVTHTPSLRPSPQEKARCRKQGVISEALRKLCSLSLGCGAWQDQKGAPMGTSTLLSASENGVEGTLPREDLRVTPHTGCHPGSAPSAHHC